MPGTKEWNELRALLSDGGASHVNVGIIGSEASAQHPGSDLTNAELGVIHEYGLGVPERSFLRRTFEDPVKLAEYRALQERLAGLVIEGKITLERAAELVGAWGAAAVQRTITESDIPPPLAAETVRRKGSSKPLVDTGQLVRSINWVKT